MDFRFVKKKNFMKNRKTAGGGGEIAKRKHRHVRLNALLLGGGIGTVYDDGELVISHRPKVHKAADLAKADKAPKQNTR